MKNYEKLRIKDEMRQEFTVLFTLFLSVALIDYNKKSLEKIYAFSFLLSLDFKYGAHVFLSIKTHKHNCITKIIRTQNNKARKLDINVCFP